MSSEPLTRDETTALDYLCSNEGPHWKQILVDCWKLQTLRRIAKDASMVTTLQRLRQKLGEKGLQAYQPARMPNLCTAHGLRSCTACNGVVR